jgi:hypothetical protein
MITDGNSCLYLSTVIESGAFSTVIFRGTIGAHLCGLRIPMISFASLNRKPSPQSGRAAGLHLNFARS